MAEYISREAVMLEIDAADFVIDANFEGGATLLYCDDVVDRLSAIPAADVRPVVRGKWKYRGQQVIDDLFPTYACSVCHDVIPADWRRKCSFCPNCGADMRAEEGE